MRLASKNKCYVAATTIVKVLSLNSCISFADSMRLKRSWCCLIDYYPTITAIEQESLNDCSQPNDDGTSWVGLLKDYLSFSSLSFHYNF